MKSYQNIKMRGDASRNGKKENEPRLQETRELVQIQVAITWRNGILTRRNIEGRGSYIDVRELLYGTARIVTTYENFSNFFHR